MTRAMSQSACSLKMRGLSIVVLCAIMQTIAVPSGWAEDASSQSPTAQKESAPSGDASDIRSRGGFRDPIGPYAAPEGEGPHGKSDEVQGRGLTDKLKSKPLDLKRQPRPGGTPPAQL